jgi:D-aminopeptidase
VGVLVQTNFGGRLTIDGVPVWRDLQPASLRAPPGGGSCMIVVATDAPLDARQLERLAARAMLGMARTGSDGGHGSGDYVIAFSTARRGERLEIPDADLSPLFAAVIEATEEAIVSSLLRATTVRGRDGHVVEAIPIDPLRRLLAPRAPA